jgi:uncharacterized protein (TIGR02246 family)
MQTDPTTNLNTLFADLANAWNDGDGARFGRYFTDGADFVNIHGAHLRGAAVIGAGHQGIFDSVYKGSQVQYHVEDTETVLPGCLLSVVRAQLDAPSGPLAGTHRSTITAVVVRDSDEWKIRAFHNTLLAE